MELKMLSLFSGIGAFEKALENIGIKINLVNFCEIDKYASQAYCAIHNVDKKLNLNDVTEIKIDSLPTSGIDIITHGSPCQDFSTAGLQAGGDIGTGTRSSLMWNSVAIIEHVNPKYVIWENVKNVLSKKHKHNFEKYLNLLESFGYNNYYKVLNAKDYGIPQNRERIYVVSIRKDIDNKNFYFPEKEPLNLKLQDLLEKEVEEKFYLKDSQVERIRNSSFMQEKRRLQDKNFCDTILARDWKDPKCVRIGGLYDTDKKTHQIGSIYDKNHLSPALDTMGGGNRQPLIAEEKEVSYIERKYQEFFDKNGYIPEMFNPYNAAEVKDIAPTQTSNCGGSASSATVYKKNSEFKIRKLTPKECWRLMGFSDQDFNKAKTTGLSNTQLYKQAGNSIVVNVLEKIFRNLFLE